MEKSKTSDNPNMPASVLYTESTILEVIVVALAGYGRMTCLNANV